MATIVVSCHGNDNSVTMATTTPVVRVTLTHSARLLTRRTELTVYPSWGNGGRAAAVITVGERGWWLAVEREG